jgi:hypothetical protein
MAWLRELPVSQVSDGWRDWGDRRALLLAGRAAAFLAAGDGAGADGWLAGSGGPGCPGRRAPDGAAAVVNAGQLGGQPIALALGLAAAAVLSLALTVLSLIRRRRQELALLKALGMTRRQVRVVIAAQTTLTLLLAEAVGGPLGIVGGRLAWQGFARSLGVVPVVEVPVLALILGLAALVVAGNLIACGPAAVAARTRPAAGVRAE